MTSGSLELLPVKRPRVLVVEDEALIRDMLVYAFEDEGYDVLAAASGDEAIRLLDGTEAPVAVVTDIRMPGRVDGLGLAAWVGERFPQTPVVVTSGYVTSAGPSNQDGTAFSFVSKPYKPAAIVELIGRMRSA